MNSRETFYRNGRMHVLLIAAGSLAILVVELTTRAKHGLAER